ncbi:MAG: hypothetical protein JWP37_2058 [Mucilaginibacter sp.]|nr:hypothetical protein [Mucilaginibacter sp.]
MKKAIYSLLIISTLLLIGKTSSAQDYKPNYQFALGLKFGGYENGISGKYFMNSTTSLEGLVGFRSHGLVFTGLYEINQQAFSVEGFRFYYGFGAHIGAVGAGVYKRFNGDNELYNNSQILLGADGVIGLEYVIPKSPIAVSLDLNPRIELATGPFFDIAPGLGVKYTF